MRVKNQTEPENSDFIVENNGTIAELEKVLTKVTKGL